VAYSYEDGQYWDDTDYVLPATTRSLSTTLYYQTTSKEYVEFLRDENVTDTLGQQMYDLWEAHGRSAPVAMVSDSTTVDWIPTAAEPLPTYVTAIKANHPNPFNATTQISYELARRSLVRLVIYDVAGRKVRTLEDGWREAGPHALAWQGLDDGKDAVASGLYLARFEADGVDTTLRIVLVK
jgi:hypothetical protein